MRQAALWLSLAVCVTFVGSLLLAQDSPKAGGEKAVGDKVVKEGDTPKGDGVKKEGDKGPKLGEIANKMNKVVKFSDEQKQQIAELNKPREAAIKEANDKFMKATLDLMTDEQKAAWEQAVKEAPKKEFKGDGVNKEGDVVKQPKGDAPKDGGGEK